MFLEKEEIKMDEFMEMEDSHAVIENKLRQYFGDRIVRENLTKRI